MTERSLEQIEAEVQAAMKAMEPHLASDMDVNNAFEAKHPELACELGRALVKRDIEKIATAEFERLVAAGKMQKVGLGEYRTVMEVSHNQPAAKEAKLTINLREVTDFIATLAPCDGKSIWASRRQISAEPERVSQDRRPAGGAGGGDRARTRGDGARRPSGGPLRLRTGQSEDDSGEALRRAADGGDKEVAAAVDELNSLATKACNVLFEAAAERHPHWRAVPGRPGEYCGPRLKDHPERDPERLLAWFERTYPAEAARITAETVACFWAVARALLEPCPQWRS